VVYRRGERGSASRSCTSRCPRRTPCYWGPPAGNPRGRYTGVVMSSETLVVHSDPEILSGTPVFVGTRVPVQSLFDYIEGGDTLDEFLRQFPSVRREQAIAALELARESLLTRARTA